MSVQVIPTIKKLFKGDFDEVRGKARNSDYLLVITFSHQAGRFY